MVNYEFKSEGSFDKMDYINEVDKAKKYIVDKNDSTKDINFERRLPSRDVPFNNKIGSIQEFHVLDSKNKIGFLHCFISNDLKLIHIYTSPQ